MSRLKFDGGGKRDHALLEVDRLRGGVELRKKPNQPLDEGPAMIRRISKLLIWCATGMALTAAGAGCAVVDSAAPVGEKPAQLEAEAWEGEWYHPRGSLTVSVLDPAAGILEVGSIQKDEQAAGRLKLQTARVLIRSFGEWLFFNIRREEGEASETATYFWGRVRQESDRILIWFPNAKRLAELVREGKIPGKVHENGNVTLDPLDLQHYRLLVEEEGGRVFLWDSPLVLFRRSQQ